MKRALCLVALIAVTSLLSLSASAQVKIGYTNVELLLSFMPEAKAMENELQVFEEQLVKDLTNRQNYLETLMNEYETAMKAGTTPPAELEKMRNNLIQLDDEIKKKAKDAEIKLQKKQDEMLAPIRDKLKDAIDKVAAESGYTYVLNSSVGGISAILHGPPSDDITEKVLTKLGIPVPEELKTKP